MAGRQTDADAAAAVGERPVAVVDQKEVILILLNMQLKEAQVDLV